MPRKSAYLLPTGQAHPRGLAPARGFANGVLIGTTEVVPFHGTRVTRAD